MAREGIYASGGTKIAATSCPQQDESEVYGKREGVRTWPLETYLRVLR